MNNINLICLKIKVIISKYVNVELTLKVFDNKSVSTDSNQTNQKPNTFNFCTILIIFEIQQQKIMYLHQ